MATLVYNQISLLRCETLAIERENVYNGGVDYLYTRVRIRVRGIYNPEVNAFTFDGGSNQTVYQNPAVALRNPANAVPVFIPVVGAGRLRAIAAQGQTGPVPPANPLTLPGEPAMGRGEEAPFTDFAIRHRLMQPRRTLFFAIGATPLIVSPSVNSDNTEAGSDAANGPLPVACDIVKISGVKSFLVDYTIETWLNETQLFRTTPSVLLSHRWDADEDVDQDYYSTRTVRGHAEFRSDRLLFLGAIPDEFRIALFHALPGPGWKRVDVKVHADQDGNSLDYILVDKQLALSIIPSGITRIEAYQTVDATGVSLERIVRETALASAQTAATVTTAAIAGFTPQQLPAILLSAASHQALALLQVATNNIPSTTVEIVVRVWGLSNIPRTTLQTTAITLALVRLRSALNPVALYGAETKMSLTHDLAGKFVECRVVKKTAMPGTAIAGLLTRENVPNLAANFPSGVGSDDSAGVLTTMHAAVPPLGLPTRPNAAGTGTRGVFIEGLATAALLNQESTPVNPPPIFPSGGAVIDRSPP